MALPMLHIYGQQCPHDTVEIRGTAEAVQLLAVLLAAAAHRDAASSPTFFTADGEGFTVSVAVASEAGMDRSALPYSDWGTE